MKLLTLVKRSGSAARPFSAGPPQTWGAWADLTESSVTARWCGFFSIRCRIAKMKNNLIGCFLCIHIMWQNISKRRTFSISIILKLSSPVGCNRYIGINPIGFNFCNFREKPRGQKCEKKLISVILKIFSSVIYRNSRHCFFIK